MKQCFRCGNVKPLDEFYKHSGMADGHLGKCKVCTRADVSAYRLPRRDEIRERRKSYFRAYRTSESGRAKRAAWQKSKKSKNGQHKWRRSERGDKLKKAANKRYLNSETFRQYRASAEWKAVVARQRAKRKAALTNKQASLTAAEWLEIRESHKYRCYWCKRKFKQLTQDHVVPLTRGGLHIKTNIVPSCQSCNSSKGNRLIHARTGQYLLAM